MSTRAIIALPAPGGFITAWNWNDGGSTNLGTELRKYFQSENIIRERLAPHSFSCVCSKKEKEELIREFPDTAKEGDFLCLSNGRYILKRKHHGSVVEGGKDGFFETIDQMLQCDLNYVYVFENGKWKTYK